jgi:hypothetical protein
MNRIAKPKPRKGSAELLLPGVPIPDRPEPKKKLITKARKDENTKRRKDKFRVFNISCFRDDPPEADYIKCEESTIKALMDSAGYIMRPEL